MSISVYLSKENLLLLEDDLFFSDDSLSDLINYIIYEYYHN